MRKMEDGRGRFYLARQYDTLVILNDKDADDDVI